MEVSRNVLSAPRLPELRRGFRTSSLRRISRLGGAKASFHRRNVLQAMPSALVVVRCLLSLKPVGPFVQAVATLLRGSTQVLDGKELRCQDPISAIALMQLLS